MAKKSLTPGSLARIYRDGTVHEENMLVPERGTMTTRSLPPGEYVARDECGGEIDFVVSALNETTTIWDPRSGRGNPDEAGTGEAGSSFVKPFGDGERDTRPADTSTFTPGFPNVGPDREAPPAGESDMPGDAPALPRRDAPEHDVETDDQSEPDRIVGQPGSSIVHDDTDQGDGVRDAANGPNSVERGRTAQAEQAAAAEAAERGRAEQAQREEGSAKERKERERAEAREAKRREAEAAEVARLEAENREAVDEAKEREEAEHEAEQETIAARAGGQEGIAEGSAAPPKLSDLPGADSGPDDEKKVKAPKATSPAPGETEDLKRVQGVPEPTSNPETGDDTPDTSDTHADPREKKPAAKRSRKKGS